MANYRNGRGAEPKPTPTPEPKLCEQFPADQVVVGEVNDGEYVLTRQELERMAAARLGEIKTEGLNPSVAADLMRKRDDMMFGILREWLVIKTIATLAYKAGLSVTPEEVQARMGEIAQETGVADVQQDLKQDATAVGITTEEMQRDIREGLMVDKYILREVAKKFKEADLQKIYLQNPNRYCSALQVHAWQIFRRLDPTMGPKETGDLRDEVHKQSKTLSKAKDKDRAALFQKLAAKTSDDTFTRNRGGDMGWIGADTVNLPQEVFDAVFNKLDPGEVSDVIKTKIGFHIMYVSERREPRGLTYDAYARQRVLDDLVERFKVEIGPGLVTGNPQLKIASNMWGYRLVNQRLEIGPMRTPPPDRIGAATATPAAGVPAALPALPTPRNAPLVAPPRITPRPTPRTATATPAPGR